MSCPYLAYRRSDESSAFDHERPYCLAQRAFVSPMQADVCTDRFQFSHVRHCDVFRAAIDTAPEDVVSPPTTDDGP